MIQVRRDGARGVGEPRFQVGTIVFHKRYRYRGVIVEVDSRCRASEQWYASNQTQPERTQPWYHVLVDEAAHTTYVAQENLMLDVSGHPVLHPLLSSYFEAYQGGAYIRNDEPFGG